MYPNPPLSQVASERARTAAAEAAAASVAAAAADAAAEAVFAARDAREALAAEVAKVVTLERLLSQLQDDNLSIGRKVRSSFLIKRSAQFFCVF